MSSLASAQEQFVLHYLAQIDMERVKRSLDYLKETEDLYLRETLFRDAVICYAKPFSGNRKSSGKGMFRISDSFVPPTLRKEHAEIIGLRNQLFAHIDLDKQAPQVTLDVIDGKNHMSFSCAGYEHVYTDHLLSPLAQLASSAFKFLHRRLQEIERNA